MISSKNSLENSKPELSEDAFESQISVKPMLTTKEKFFQEIAQEKIKVRDIQKDLLKDIKEQKKIPKLEMEEEEMEELGMKSQLT